MIDQLVKQLGFKEVREVLVRDNMFYFRALDPNFLDDVEVRVSGDDGVVSSRVASPAGIDIDVVTEGEGEYVPIGSLSMPQR